MKDQRLAIKSSGSENALRNQLMDVALEIHKNIGLGLGREEYGKALETELTLRSMNFAKNQVVKLDYKGSVAGEYNLDFIVEDSIALAISSGESNRDIDEGRLRSILKTLKLKLGLVINFSKDILEIKTVER